MHFWIYVWLYEQLGALPNKAVVSNCYAHTMLDSHDCKIQCPPVHDAIPSWYIFHVVIIFVRKFLLFVSYHYAKHTCWIPTTVKFSVQLCMLLTLVDLFLFLWWSCFHYCFGIAKHECQNMHWPMIDHLSSTESNSCLKSCFIVVVYLAFRLFFSY